MIPRETLRLYCGYIPQLGGTLGLCCLHIPQLIRLFKQHRLSCSYVTSLLAYCRKQLTVNRFIYEVMMNCKTL